MSSDHNNSAALSLEAVRRGEMPLLWSLPDGRLLSSVKPQPQGIVSGSFDPRHHGHEQLRDAAQRFLQGPVHFEMSLTNVEKPAMDDATVERRCHQFHDHPLALTAAATFVEKAILFPQTVFVVGFDTAVRIIDSQFYSDDRPLHAALTTITDQACSFLVAGRLVGERFQTLNDIDMPPELRSLFEELPETLFREDVSSTGLREK